MPQNEALLRPYSGPRKKKYSQSPQKQPSTAQNTPKTGSQGPKTPPPPTKMASPSAGDLGGGVPGPELARGAELYSTRKYNQSHSTARNIQLSAPKRPIDEEML